MLWLDPPFERFMPSQPISTVGDCLAWRERTDPMEPCGLGVSYGFVEKGETLHIQNRSLSLEPMALEVHSAALFFFSRRPQEPGWL